VCRSVTSVATARDAGGPPSPRADALAQSGWSHIYWNNPVLLSGAAVFPECTMRIALIRRWSAPPVVRHNLRLGYQLFDELAQRTWQQHRLVSQRSRIRSPLHRSLRRDTAPCARISSRSTSRTPAWRTVRSRGAVRRLVPRCPTARALLSRFLPHLRLDLPVHPGRGRLPTLLLLASSPRRSTVTEPPAWGPNTLVSRGWQLLGGNLRCRKARVIVVVHGPGGPFHSGWSRHHSRARIRILDAVDDSIRRHYREVHMTEGERRDIHPATAAALWVLSNGRCYWPGCVFPILVETRKGVYRKNAQIAHIFGVRPGAARFRTGLSEGERDSFANLVLLCTAHHTEVDNKRDGERLYPPERLREWKVQHEGTNGPALATLGPISEEGLETLLARMFEPPVRRLEKIADQLEKTGTLNTAALAELRQIIAIAAETSIGTDARTVAVLADASEQLTGLNLGAVAAALVDAAEQLRAARGGY
jgi:hypothetical protein